MLRLTIANWRRIAAHNALRTALGKLHLWGYSTGRWLPLGVWNSRNSDLSILEPPASFVIPRSGATWESPVRWRNHFRGDCHGPLALAMTELGDGSLSRFCSGVWGCSFLVSAQETNQRKRLGEALTAKPFGTAFWSCRFSPTLSRPPPDPLPAPVGGPVVVVFGTTCPICHSEERSDVGISCKMEEPF